MGSLSGLIYLSQFANAAGKTVTSRPSNVNIGGIFSFNSTIGRVAKIAVEAAVADVNADSSVLGGTNLTIQILDSKCSGFTGIVEALQFMETDVVAVIGPQTSVAGHLISHVANELQVPLLSFSATDPSLSSLQFPFFLRTSQSDLYQMTAVAEIVDYHGWKEVIAVYMDNDYGRNGIAALGDALAQRIECTYLIPHDWGGFVQPWIEAMVKSYPGLEELRLKRMVVSDDSLELISHSFRNLKSLVLVTCDGFSTDGLAAIAANSKVLRELDLQENEIEDDKGNWLSCFPETCTSLVSLNFACLKGDVNLGALERLVARNPNLRSLKLNRAVPLDTLQKILVRAPQLVDLGIGSYMAEPPCESYRRFIDAAMKCRSVRSLSGFWEVAPRCLKAVYSMCLNLTSLNLSYAPGIPGKDLIKLMPTKPDPVTAMPLDEGFGAIVQSYKGLKRLSLSGLLTDQVFLYVGMYAEQLEMLSVAFAGDSDKGMLYVLNGCKNLRKLEIRDNPFGDGALLADVGKYETMRSLWMSSCDVTLGACKTLAKKMHRLNVEIINEKEHMEENFDDTEKVEKMYVYRTLDGPRRDAPDFVWSLSLPLLNLSSFLLLDSVLSCGCLSYGLN